MKLNLNQTINNVKNWNTNYQAKKVITLCSLTTIVFVLALIGYYFFNFKKIILHKFFLQFFGLIFLIITITLYFFLLNENNDFLNSIKNQHILNAYLNGYKPNNFLNVYTFFENQNNFLITLNSQEDIMITEIAFVYFRLLAMAKSIFAFIIILIFIFILQFILFFNLILIKLETSIQIKLLFCLEFLLNPLGLIWTNYYANKHQIKYKIRNLWLGKIYLLQEIWLLFKIWYIKIYSLLKKNENEKIENFEFNDTKENLIDFINIKNLNYSYHTNKYWHWLEHQIYKLFGSKKHEKSLITNKEASNFKQPYFLVLKGINLKIAKNKFTTIIGPNGCGKSTLIKAIMNINKNYGGQIYWAHKNLKYISNKSLAQNVAHIGQNVLIPENTLLYDFIGYGRAPYLQFMSFLNKQDHEIIKNVLQITKLTHLANKLVNELSGGQLQKAIFAMALAQTTKTIILDEPTTYLDIKNQYELLNLLSNLKQKENKTIIAILHDINQAAQYSDEIIVMNNGEIYDIGPPNKVINEKMLKEVFHLEAILVRKNNKVFITKMNLINKNTTNL